jgi:MauM/NapG family ferredoxin protein
MTAASWKSLRRTSQLLFFALACLLLVATSYPLAGGIPYDIIPRLSPLLAAAAMLAARAFIAAFWPALAVIVLTLAFGRAFCGWVCPLGALFDAGDFVIKKVTRRRYREGEKPRHRRWRFLVLAAALIFAAFGVPLAGWLDPLSLFPRTLAVSALPYAGLAVDHGSRLLYRVPAFESAVASLRQAIVSENVVIIPGHVVVGAFVLLLLALGFARRRFYCRYVCPTGALLALVGWPSPFGRRVEADSCTECRRCRHVCRMGAIGGVGDTTAMAECNLCMDCLSACGPDAVSFGWTARKKEQAGTEWAPAMSRRSFLAAVPASAAGAAAVAVLDRRAARDPFLVRPPGALAEDEFAARCVRCGECVRVCLTQGLAPAHFEAGLTGLWTPRLVSRVGYCEYRCTLCTQVCPSDALQPLTEAQKKKFVIGVAVIDRRRCLPWAEKDDCSVCEEMCPTAPKAILLQGNGRLKPRVQPCRCVGCGICEYACPVEGESAIRVIDKNAAAPAAFREGDNRRRRRGRR